MNIVSIMNRTSTKPFPATITIGLQTGYTHKQINKCDVIAHLQNWQDELIHEKNLYLSVSVSDCQIVLSGQVEPHLKLSFINYPRFPLKEEVLKQEIEALTKSLIKSFKQNRVVIEYPDETVMFEDSPEIDPRIKNTVKR